MPVLRDLALPLIVLVLFAIGCTPRLETPPATAGTAFENGLWFDGEGFAPGTWYAVDGRFTRTAPAVVGQRVDLQGGYALPSFAEAHNHNLQNAWGVQQAHARYREHGVMYAAMLCGNGESAQAAREALGPAPGVDVLFGSACISSSDGHHLRMARTQPDGTLAPVEDIHDSSYIVMDTVADVERKWPLVRAASPDLVKAILVHSERPEHRDNPNMHGINGLAPEVLAPLLRRAHAEGLRVVAHTESAADFRTAVEAGVDWIGHLPGYRFWDGMDESDYRLDDATIRLAAGRGIAVVATANLAEGAARGDATALARVQALQRDNLSRLIDAGVVIAIGSDRYDATSLVEFDYLRTLGVMGDGALLRAMVEHTPRLLYPDRRIGRIEEGFEANFLVLEGDPLADPGEIRRIRHRAWRGQLLE